MIYDVIIVGGGPIGLACAIEAKRKNLSYLILEKGALTNSLFNYPLHMTFFSTAEKLEIGQIPFNCVTPKPGRQEALDYYRNIARYFELNINLYEEVYEINQTDSKDQFIIKTSKSTYQTQKVIIATGFYDIPHLMHVEGEELPLVEHYYKEAHPYSFRKVVVIGANNSSVDAALECYRKGADVTMIIRGKEFTNRLKYWVKPDIENRINEGSIKAYFNSDVVKINPNSITFKTNENEMVVETDHILALTGYEPNFDFLEKAGIEFQNDDFKTPIYDPNSMETNVKGLYLAGVVCGGMQTNIWFIENSRIHAEQIINHITSNK